MADPFAAFVDPFAAYAEPYHPAAGHTAAEMLGTPSAPYAEGVNPADTWQNKTAAALEPLAHPKTATDLAALAIPGGMGEALAPYLKPIQAGASKYGGAAVDLATSFLPKKGQAALKVLGELKPTNWHNPLTVAGRDARAADASMQSVVPTLAEDIGPHVLRGAEQYREPYQAPAPNAGEPTMEELRKAGVGDKSLALMERRKAEAAGRAASPEAGEQVPHPAITRTNPAAATEPAMEPMPSHAPANTADVNLSTPLANPRVANVNPRYPWTPEQASQIRLGLSDWHSGAPSGTPAARAGQNLHIEDHILDQRYRQLLSDPKKALLLPLLAPQVRQALLAQMSERSGSE